MKINEIRKIASELGIKNFTKFKKGELVLEIQRAEGNFDCFGTAGYFCDQEDCYWREDCLKPLPQEENQDLV